MSPLYNPILYSFRRCPYAIRARLALASAGIVVELREVDLKHKPAAMLGVSSKGTVPVLQLLDGQVIEQSLDIMLWALQQNDPDGWLHVTHIADTKQLIASNDGEFKYYLDRYKYPDRYPQQSQSDYCQQAEPFLLALERRLTNAPFLCGQQFSWADAAILPFIRQFAAVDHSIFASLPYSALQCWLQQFLDSQLFVTVMQKYTVWQPGDTPTLFPVEAIGKTTQIPIR